MAQNLNKILDLCSFQSLLSIKNYKFHTSSFSNAWAKDNQRGKWLNYNKVIFPVQQPGEERRPAYVCHEKRNIKYSPKKMWYISSFIRGMSVDEAIKQLKFVSKKGAKDIIKTLEEAKELAVSQHNVEFKSNLWVAESFCGKGPVIKGLRRHARARFGIIRYVYCNYFVRLEEGKPPEHYYHNHTKKPEEQLQEWIESMRKRKINNSL